MGPAKGWPLVSVAVGLPRPTSQLIRRCAVWLINSRHGAALIGEAPFWGSAEPSHGMKGRASCQNPTTRVVAFQNTPRRHSTDRQLRKLTFGCRLLENPQPMHGAKGECTFDAPRLFKPVSERPQSQGRHSPQSHLSCFVQARPRPDAATQGVVPYLSFRRPTSCDLTDAVVAVTSEHDHFYRVHEAESLGLHCRVPRRSARTDRRCHAPRSARSEAYLPDI